jgi:hypothetical protein
VQFLYYNVPEIGIVYVNDYGENISDLGIAANFDIIKNLQEKVIEVKKVNTLCDITTMMLTIASLFLLVFRRAKLDSRILAL